MSTVTSLASASATPSAAACNNLYEIPVQDASCAMPYGGNHTDIMSRCCNDADVVSYWDECGLYCLAIDQSVGDLTECLYENGASWQDVFCRGNVTASATATDGGEVPSTASATVVSTGGSSSSDDDDDDDNNNGSGSSGSSDDDDDDDSAATGLKPSGLTTAGLAIGFLLAFGAVAA